MQHTKKRVCVCRRCQRSYTRDTATKSSIYLTDSRYGSWPIGSSTFHFELINIGRKQLIDMHVLHGWLLVHKGIRLQII